MLESSPTVGDIFKKHGAKFRQEHGLHPRQHKVMYDIEHCRCGEFGTHWEICDACGHMEKGYNSCRNRHCPGCNNIARRKWVDARIKDLLPVSYHHCVFTLPHEFNPLCRFNRRVMYDLLFECSAQTLLEALNNVQKHAAATRAVIKLVGAYPYIILRIEDNGKGFDLKERERSMIKEKRMGIWSMKERANLLHGRMDIHSQLNRGTKIVVKLILEDKRKWMGKNRL